jgi:uncharacterized protein (TIGR00369 family)
MEQKSYNDDNYCFVCGTANPHGLKLTFSFDEKNEEMVSRTVFPKHFQGWEGVLHGGLISTVMDEIMIKAAHHKGFKCVTAELNIRFKKPALLKKEFTIKGKVTEIDRRLIRTEGKIIDSDNIIIATANGKFVVVE